MDYPIRIVAGNWFKLTQPLSKIVWENSTREIVDYEPAEGDTFKVTLIGSYSPYEMQDAHIKEDTTNVLVYENNGTLPLGMYDIEIRVVLADGKRLRSYQTDIIKIVKTNREASIPNTTEFGIDTFELQGAVFMYVPNGEGGGGDMSNYYTKDEADELFMPANTPIPSEVTESIVSGWGFTKNEGTYSKPSSGIPKTDLASDVQASLNKADNAIQKAAQGTTGLLKPDGSIDSNTYLTTQQQVDWNAQSGVTSIANKPTIPTVPIISTDVSADSSSNTKTASPKAVADYVDSICGAILTRLQSI